MITSSERAWLKLLAADERDEVVASLTLVKKFPGTSKSQPAARAIVRLVEMIDALEAQSDLPVASALAKATARKAAT